MNPYERSKVKTDYDVSKAIFVDPFFVSYDFRRGIKLIESEQANVKMVDQIDQCAKTTGLEQRTLLTKEMAADEITDYNTMSLMNSWTQEHLAHSESRIDMIPLMTAFTSRLADTYGTSHFIYTGAFSSVQERDTGNLWAYTCLLPVLLPITLALEATPIRRTEIYFMVFDVKEGKTVDTSETLSKGGVSDGKIIAELNKQMKRIQ